MKPSIKKPKTKKFVGYVPKKETIQETIDYLRESLSSNVTFGMESKKEMVEAEKVVKRTITLTWIDEEVKEKK